MKHVRDVQKRFGIPDEVFARLAALEAQDTVFVGTPEVMRFDAVRPMRRGIRLCRLFQYSVKPTTWAMQVLGRAATRNVIDLDDRQARDIINGTDLKTEAEVENGFVLLKWRGYVVGVGLYKRPNLKSQIPRFRPVE